MTEPIEKIIVNIEDLPLRELKRVQAIIDKVEYSKIAMEPIKITRYERWVHWWSGKKMLVGIGAVAVGITMAVVSLPGETVVGISGAVTALIGLVHKMYKSDDFGGASDLKTGDDWGKFLKDLINLILRAFKLAKK